MYSSIYLESNVAETDYRDYLRKYIDEARAAGATPILVTPMHRRTFNEDGTLNDNLKPYTDAMKAVAAEKKVSMVDLHTSSGKLFLKLGDEKSMEMASKPTDRTHVNQQGAEVMAGLVMKELAGILPGELLGRDVK